MTKRIVLLQALASTPADITRLIKPLDEATASWKLKHDTWTPRDVVSHLIHVEQAYQIRLNRILVEDEPTVPFIHPDEAIHDRETLIAHLGEQFRQTRGATLTTLQALNPGEWQRVAIHETKGRTTLRYLVQDLVAHDIEHTNQLVEIIQSWRAMQKQKPVATTTEAVVQIK